MLEDLAVAGKRRHAFLDARTAGVEQADHRRAVLHSHLLDFDDLLRVSLGQRPAEHRKVFRIHIDHAAVDRAAAGDHAVTGNDGLVGIEILVAMLNEHVELLEGVLIQQ